MSIQVQNPLTSQSTQENKKDFINESWKNTDKQPDQPINNQNKFSNNYSSLKYHLNFNYDDEHEIQLLKENLTSKTVIPVYRPNPLNDIPKNPVNNNNPIKNDFITSISQINNMDSVNDQNSYSSKLTKTFEKNVEKDNLLEKEFNLESYTNTIQTNNTNNFIFQNYIDKPVTIYNNNNDNKDNDNNNINNNIPNSNTDYKLRSNKPKVQKDEEKEEHKEEKVIQKDLLDFDKKEDKDYMNTKNIQEDTKVTQILYDDLKNTKKIDDFRNTKLIEDEPKNFIEEFKTTKEKNQDLRKTKNYIEEPTTIEQRISDYEDIKNLVHETPNNINNENFHEKHNTEGSLLNYVNNQRELNQNNFNAIFQMSNSFQASAKAKLKASRVADIIVKAQSNDIIKSILKQLFTDKIFYNLTSPQVDINYVDMVERTVFEIEKLEVQEKEKLEKTKGSYSQLSKVKYSSNDKYRSRSTGKNLIKKQIVKTEGNIDRDINNLKNIRAKKNENNKTKKAFVNYTRSAFGYFDPGIQNGGESIIKTTQSKKKRTGSKKIINTKLK